MNTKDFMNSPWMIVQRRYEYLMKSHKYKLMQFLIRNGIENPDLTCVQVYEKGCQKAGGGTSLVLIYKDPITHILYGFLYNMNDPQLFYGIKKHLSSCDQQNCYYFGCYRWNAHIPSAPL